MAGKETRRQRGRRNGLELVARVLGELRNQRTTFDVSMDALASQLGCSKSTVSRRLAGQDATTVVGLSELASALGMEVSVGLHPVGDPIRDAGQRGTGKRFDAILAPAWAVTDEVPFPIAGDQRAWDKFLRLRESIPPYLVGVDIEARIRDIQALVRRTRLRERDGGVDAILIVLSESSTNRRLLGQLLDALGPAYLTSARAILGALRNGRPLPGSGVILI